MGNVGPTTTQTTPLDAPPSLPLIARDLTSGYQYALVQNTAGNWEIRDSVDGGNNWTLLGTMTRANVVEFSRIVIDKNDWLHFAYRTNESSQDRLYYRRFNVDTLTLSAELLMAADGNGAVAGSVWQGLDIAVVRNWNGSYAIVVAGAYTVGTTKYGVILNGVSIDTGGVIYLNHGIIQSVREWWTNGTAPGRSTPSVEVEHNGDGFTAGTPNLWVSWGRAMVNQVKVAWVGSTGWQGPTQHNLIKTPVPAMDYRPAVWDGVRYVMASINPDASSTVSVYERNQANTTTTTRTTPTHPTGVIRNIALSYDANTKDLRVFAVGTSTTVLYSCTYVRATGVWSSWAIAVATAVLGATGNQFGVRAGGSYGNARFNIITAHATPTPNTVVSTAQTVAYAPYTPTWNQAGMVYENGAAANVGAALVLAWVFSDPDPADTQQSYSLSRQIGNGTLSYWRASDSTWQATEQVNTTATPSVTLAASWAVATDAQYAFKVKVRDSAGLASGYSAAWTLIPSAQVNPAVTAPAAAAVITTNGVTVTWTATEQSAFRVTLDKNPADPNGLWHDSGWQSSTALRTYTVPVVLADLTAWTVTLQTKNTEGLASTVQSRNFTVDYIEPATPTLAFSPLPSLGILRVTVTNPAPSGGQPVLTGQDLYRRVVGDTSAGVRLVAGAASGLVYDDWRAVSGVAYQYRVRADGANGTSIYSAWTT